MKTISPTWDYVPNKNKAVDLCHIKNGETGIALTTCRYGPLIASAPDMFLALEVALAVLYETGGKDSYQAIELIDAALTKAKGVT
jgi:hypothetical protein